jgi:hypothetical protein
MTLTRKFTLATALIALILTCLNDARSDELSVNQTPVPPVPDPALQSDSNAEIEIIPAAKAPTDAPSDAAAEYARIYRSIPFSRAEYRVNPNYRHDTTMELLTGRTHSQTVVHHNHEHKQPEVRIPEPARPSRILTPVAGPFGGWGWGFNNWYNGRFAW